VEELKEAHKKHLLPGFDDRPDEVQAIEIITADVTRVKSPFLTRVLSFMRKVLPSKTETAILSRANEDSKHGENQTVPTRETDQRQPTIITSFKTSRPLDRLPQDSKEIPRA